VGHLHAEVRIADPPAVDKDGVQESVQEDSEHDVPSVIQGISQICRTPSGSLYFSSGQRIGE
jgi:hypothetical protein